MYAIVTVAVMITAGVLLARSNPALGQLCACRAGLALLLACAAVVLSGVFGQYDASLFAAHRWLAHGSVVALWLAAPLAIGVAAALAKRSWALLACRLFMILLCGVMVLWTSFTGYLYPHDDPAAEATINRFWVLHGVVMPVITLVFIANWCYAFWPRESEFSNNASNPSLPRGNS